MAPRCRLGSDLSMWIHAEVPGEGARTLLKVREALLMMMAKEQEEKLLHKQISSPLPRSHWPKHISWPKSRVKMCTLFLVPGTARSDGKGYGYGGG